MSPNPQRRAGFKIPRSFQTLEDGRCFLRYDSGIEDPGRTKTFATDEALMDMVKISSDCNFKCTRSFF